MVKNKEIEQESTKQTAQKSSGSFFNFLVIIIIFAVGAASAGGFCYVKMQEQQQQIFDLERKTANLQKISNKQNDLEQRISNLENLSFEATSNLSANDSVEFEDMRRNFDKWIDEKENAINGTLQKLQDTSVNNEPQMPEVLLAVGALTVQDIAERGRPFAYEAEVLQILAQDNPQAKGYTAEIQEFSYSGITGSKALIEGFNNIYAVLNDMPTVELQAQAETDEPETQNWYEKVWKWIKKFAIHHKKMPKPVFAADKDEIYKLVNEGRFTEALNKMKIDVKYNSINAPMLQEWQKQAEAYVEFESAIQALIMNSLANIRLKEMQR
jgi:hypothetical protein